MALLLNLLIRIETINSKEPNYQTSHFFRAGNKRIIYKYTPSGTRPTYTFSYSTPTLGQPQIAYGIQEYEGNDYFGDERFEALLIEST